VIEIVMGSVPRLPGGIVETPALDGKENKSLAAVSSQIKSGGLCRVCLCPQRGGVVQAVSRTTASAMEPYHEGVGIVVRSVRRSEKTWARKPTFCTAAIALFLLKPPALSPPEQERPMAPRAASSLLASSEPITAAHVEGTPWAHIRPEPRRKLRLRYVQNQDQSRAPGFMQHQATSRIRQAQPR